MKPIFRFLNVVPVIGILALAGCKPDAAADVFTGYVEAEYVTVSAPEAGWLTAPLPETGTEVALGTLLFTLDDDYQKTALAAAEGRLAEADAKVRDLETGARPAELSVLQAKLAQAQANRRLTAAELKRVAALRDRSAASASRLDQATAADQSAAAAVQALSRDVDVARLAARPAAIKAADAARNAAAAAVDGARWSLERRQVAARVAGRVEQVFFRQGEYAQAGSPVLAILPPGQLKVRFFVPQGALPRLQLGSPVDIRADGLTAPVEGHVSFIAAEAEYTPPVIYSAGSRDTLVFLVEARVADVAGLHPGLPVDVRAP